MGRLLLRPAGSAFVRPGGREGQWWPDAEEDDTVACPFDFVVLAGSTAEAAVADLRQSHADMTPLILGSPHEAAFLFERMDIFEHTADDWLAGMSAFDLDAWFGARVSEVQGWQAKTGKVIPARGRWPGDDRSWQALTVPKDPISGEFRPEVLVALLPTPDPADAAAYLRFGGWNDCPKPPVHIALARDWRDRYGAVLTAQTYKSLEFQISRPVSGREDAERVAMEHYHYCRESVSDTLQTAAAELLGSKVWHFWWN